MVRNIERRIDELTDIATADNIKIDNYRFSEKRKAACVAIDVLYCWKKSLTL